jgi:hypothetical protein
MKKLSFLGVALGLPHRVRRHRKRERRPLAARRGRARRPTAPPLLQRSVSRRRTTRWCWSCRLASARPSQLFNHRRARRATPPELPIRLPRTSDAHGIGLTAIPRGREHAARAREQARDRDVQGGRGPTDLDGIEHVLRSVANRIGGAAIVAALLIASALLARVHDLRWFTFAASPPPSSWASTCSGRSSGPPESSRRSLRRAARSRRAARVRVGSGGGASGRPRRSPPAGSSRPTRGRSTGPSGCRRSRG